MFNWIRLYISPLRKWITNNPRKAGAITLIAFSPALDYFLKTKARYDLITPVYKKIELGTKPPIPIANIQNMVPREELEDELHRLFFPSTCKNDTFFGLVIGPSGSGKTVAVRNLCNRFPTGVLYYEVKEPRFFAQHLAKEAHVKIKPTNVFDLAMGYLSDKYIHYLRLPQSSIESAAMVIETIEEAAERYVLNHGIVPVLFIDGVDLLTKHDLPLFNRLMNAAKIMANNNTLSIVFISSEGTVIPQLKKFSGMTRSTQITEVGDISDVDARNYLVKRGITETMAKKLVDFFGGRFAYLRSSIKLIAFNEKFSLTEDELFEKLKNGMFALKLEKQKSVIANEQPFSGRVLKKVSEEGLVSPSSFGTGEESIAYNKAINAMVNENIFRYDCNGMLAWHSKVTKTFFMVQ